MAIIAITTSNSISVNPSASREIPGCATLSLDLVSTTTPYPNTIHAKSKGHPFQET